MQLQTQYGIRKMNKHRIHCTINGKEYDRIVKDNTLLVDFLREELGLTGTKIGCDGGECGCCTILMNGNPQHACLTLAAKCDNMTIETIEYLNYSGRLSAIQRGFHEKHGSQCGFCTPGMVMAAVDIVARHPQLDETTVRQELEGNLCRCTGYHNIVKSILAAANAGG